MLKCMANGFSFLFIIAVLNIIVLCNWLIIEQSASYWSVCHHHACNFYILFNKNADFYSFESLLALLVSKYFKFTVISTPVIRHNCA